MTVHQGGYHTAIKKARKPARIFMSRRKMTDRLVAIPIALDLQTIIIESSAAITVGEFLSILILNGLFRHFLVLPESLNRLFIVFPLSFNNAGQEHLMDRSD